MSIKSGVLGKTHVGSGTLFEQSMTEAARHGQFSDWKPGERKGFSPMPVVGQGQGTGQGFGDIKELTRQQGIGGQEFLADRAAGKGALSGIVYRPTAGIVGAAQIPGGSRWFDFPGGDSQQTRGKLDLGMDKQSSTQASLSLLGTTTRLGGGDLTPTNQFGQDIANGVNKHSSGRSSSLSMDASMDALLGSPIVGGPKRETELNGNGLTKDSSINSKKLNLFGLVSKY
jgi:hypothetical protein